MVKFSNSAPDVKVPVRERCCLTCLWPTRLLYKLVLLGTGNLFLVTTLIYIFCYYINIPTQEQTFTKTCYQSSEYLQQLDHLAYRVSHTLKASNLTHFLCYDSLWGEIHYKSNSPWADKVQLCIINEEVETADSFYNEFNDQGLDVKYDWLEGLYKVTDPRFCGGQVQLILFKTDPEAQWLRRIGLKRFRLAPDCRDLSLHCFHPYLLVPPLPLVPFGSGYLPVPRYGTAIQKHHYSNKTNYNNMDHNKPPFNC